MRRLVALALVVGMVGCIAGAARAAAEEPKSAPAGPVKALKFTPADFKDLKGEKGATFTDDAVHFSSPEGVRVDIRRLASAKEAYQAAQQAGPLIETAAGPLGRIGEYRTVVPGSNEMYEPLCFSAMTFSRGNVLVSVNSDPSYEMDLVNLAVRIDKQISAWVEEPRDAAPAAKATAAPSSTATVVDATYDSLLAETACGDVKREEAAAKELWRRITDKKVSADDPRALAALRALLLSGHGDASLEAATVLAYAIGMPALDAGLEAVRSDNRIARLYGTYLLGSLAKRNPDQVEKFAAAADEISKFMKGDDRGLKTNAVQALACMGPKAIPGLVLGLAEKMGIASDGTINRVAIQGLASVGKPAVPALLEAMKSEDPNTRMSAAWALGGMKGGEGLEALPALLDATHDKDSRIRINAAHSIGLMGPAAKSAAPRLLEMIGAGDTNIVYSMMRLTISPDLVDRSVKLFAGLPKGERQEFCRAVATAGEAAVPRLIEALDANNDDTRQGAAMTLYFLGPKAEPAVAALVKALNRTEPYDSWVAEALGQIGPGAKAAAPALIDCLKQDKWASPISDRFLIHSSPAARALGSIGQPAVPELLKGLKSDNELVQAGCAQALMIGGKGSEKEAVPALLELLKGKRNAAVKGLAMSALVQLGADKDVLLPAFQAVADSDDRRAAYWARECIDRLNKKGP
jgi:HEAT repeat protein